MCEFIQQRLKDRSNRTISRTKYSRRMNIPPIAFLFMLLPIAGQLYISYGVWQILPDILWLKIIIITLMTLAFLLFFVAMSGWLDKLPLELATISYNVGTSWLIVLLYMFILFAVISCRWMVIMDA